MNDEQLTNLQIETGKQLRAIRKKLNLTLKEAAIITGKTYQEISLVEQGKKNITVGTLEIFEKAYGYTVKIKFVKTKS